MPTFHLDPRPACSIVYPPFLNGRYMEPYFYDFWASLSQADPSFVQKYLYVDVFWHNVFHAYGVPAAVAALAPLIQQLCHTAKEKHLTPFTVCQWDDGTCLSAAKPDNLVVFSLGQSVDVPLPLIVEDTTEHLLNLPRLPYEQRHVLCSFVGTITHPLRARMVDALQGQQGFEFHTNQAWSSDVPSDLVQQFVSTTQHSLFALAPRGYGPSSFRFWEICQMNVVPVYVHDGDNALPFRDILDYSKFAVVTHIDEIHQLPDKLAAISRATYGQMLIELDHVTRTHFSMQGTCNNIVRILATMHEQQQQQCVQ